MEIIIEDKKIEIVIEMNDVGKNMSSKVENIERIVGGDMKNIKIEIRRMELRKKKIVSGKSKVIIKLKKKIGIIIKKG